MAPYFGAKMGSPEMAEKVSRMTEAQILIACEQDIDQNFELSFAILGKKHRIGGNSDTPDSV